MRTALTIILYGLALGLAGLAAVMVGYGIWTAGTATDATPALAVGPIYAIATYRVAMGTAALVLALAALVAGGRARA